MGEDQRTVEPRRPKVDQNIGTVVGERYRVLEKLGEGGMGTVYLGEHVQVARRVALKILHPQFADDDEVVHRFVNEAKAAGSLDHPHVAAALDFGETDSGCPFIVLEFLKGRSLADTLSQVGKLPWGAACQIGKQVAEALHAAHGRGIIHRDLKPENIFLLDSPEPTIHVKVLDFGISKFVDLATSAVATRTRAGAVMGTPQYMAPEQFLDASSSEPRTDVYALGAVLYEVLTGVRAHRSETFGALAIEVVSEEPVHLLDLDPTLPPPLAELVMSCIAKDVDDRPSSMQTVAHQISSLSERQVPTRATAGFAGSDGLLSPTEPGRSPTAMALDAVPGLNGARASRFTWLATTSVVVLTLGLGVMWVVMPEPQSK